MAGIDRLAFYNAYAVWREVMGAAGSNLQDVQYGFQSQIMNATREFARHGMCENLVKKLRTKEIDKKRALVTDPEKL